MRIENTYLALGIFVVLGLSSCGYSKDEKADSQIDISAQPVILDNENLGICDSSFSPVDTESIGLLWETISSQTTFNSYQKAELTRLNVKALDDLRDHIGVPLQGVHENAHLFLVKTLGQDEVDECHFLLYLEMSMDGRSREFLWVKGDTSANYSMVALLYADYSMAECVFRFSSSIDGQKVNGIFEEECYDFEKERKVINSSPVIQSLKLHKCNCVNMKV